MKDFRIRMYLNILVFVILDIVSQELQIISINDYQKARYYRKTMIILLGTKWPIFGGVMIKLSTMFFELNWYNNNMRAINRTAPLPEALVKIKKLIITSYLILNPLPYSIFMIAGLLDFSIEKMQIISQITVMSYGFEIFLFAFIIVNISQLIKFFEKQVDSKQNNNIYETILSRSKKVRKYFLPMLVFTMPYVLSWIFPMMVNISSVMLNLCSLCGILCGFVIINLIMVL